MSNGDDLQQMLDDARAAGDAIGLLAADSTSFLRVAEGFAARDPEAVRDVLERAGLLERCELICDWFTSKHCTIACLTLCGAPDVELGPDDVVEAAALTGGLADDLDSLKELVDAVQRVDVDRFRALADRLKLGRFCHVICHWICWVSFDWVCSLVCAPESPPDLEPVEELAEQARILGELARDPGRLAVVRDGIERGDCERAREALDPVGIGGRCFVLCRWFCAWRCIRVCGLLCRPFPEPPLPLGPKEMLAFARTVPRLVKNEALLRQLLVAVVEGDEAAWSAAIEKLRLGRYCFQICHWLCFLRCRLICECICPPLTCDVTDPVGCVEEEADEQFGALTVEVKGSAGGPGFARYTLQWRLVEGRPCEDDSDWSDLGVHYPGGLPFGSVPVFGGTLGWIETTTWSPASFEVRLCVYGRLGKDDRRCCCTQFSLLKKLVYISRVGPPPVRTPPGPFDSTAPIVDPPGPAGIVVPVGGCVTVRGSAYVGECNDRKIKCFDLRYAIGWQPGPNDVGFNPAVYTGAMLAPTGPVCYTDPDPTVEAGKRAPWNMVIGERALTTRFVQTTIDLGSFTITVWKLQDFCFSSDGLLPLGVNDGPCPDPHHRCRSGKYTVLLEVTDTLGNVTYDTQQVWFDNKPISVEFTGLETVPRCSDVDLAKHAPAGGPCGVPWPLNATGIVYDEYIDETDTSYPSDNFDFYSLSVTRQGGPSFTVPVTPDLVTFGPDPYRGTTRVGDPGSRCEPLPPTIGCPAPPPIPSRTEGLLTKLDLRMFDANCAPSLPAIFQPPPGFALKRGECCGYTFQLYGQDTTWSDGWAGGFHHAWSLPWAVCVCNDLDRREG
ncbi:MAG TPA: hypothetical protein VID47_14410 [Actinomycetota bacterium]